MVPLPITMVLRICLKTSVGTSEAPLDCPFEGVQIRFTKPRKRPNRCISTLTKNEAPRATHTQFLAMPDPSAVTAPAQERGKSKAAGLESRGCADGGY